MFPIALRAFIVAIWVTQALSVAADDAKEAHKRGVTLYNEGKYLEASRAFREANELRPSWKLFFNIGQAEAAAKRYGLALEAFESYLMGGGDNVPEERRDYVTTEIQRIRVLVGSLKIETKETLDVFIDDEHRATTPLTAAIRVAAGDHTVVLKKGEETVYRSHVRLSGGMESIISPEQDSETREEEADDIDDTPASAAADDTPVSAAAEETPKKPLIKPIGFGLLGGGLAVTAGGVITGALALVKGNELKDSCPEQVHCTEEDKKIKDSSDRLALVTNILLPVGSVIATTGLVLIIMGSRKSSANSDAARVQVIPIAARDTAGVLLTGRF
jgi:hypothetical protein